MQKKKKGQHIQTEVGSDKYHRDSTKLLPHQVIPL